MRSILLQSAILFTVVNGQFRIPLPFGGLLFNKNKEGQLEIAQESDVNFFGFGGRRNVKLVTGEGKFDIQKEEIAYVNGSEFGGANSFTFDKQKGVDVGANLTLADNKAVGGIGRETNFFEGLFGALGKLSQKKDAHK